MNGLSFPIILQLAGIAVIIAEIILPSGGLLTVLAIGIFGYSLYVVFTQFSAMIGAIFLALDVVMIPVLVIIGLKMLAKSPITLRTVLSSAAGVTSQNPMMEQYLGKTGRAISNLRPAGTAYIEGKRVDVVTQGEYIEKESAISVHAVTGNQIIVKSVKTEV